MFKFRNLRGQREFDIHFHNFIVMKNYSNKAEVIIDLQKKGYELDYILKSENLLCLQDQELLNQDDFEIVETHRFKSEILRK